MDNIKDVTTPEEVVETVETPIDTTVEETPEVTVTEEETPKLKSFDPENPEFDMEEEIAKFDPTSLGLDETQIKEYQHLFDGMEEMGVTPDQMGGMFDMIAKIGAHETHKNLNSNLSNEEKKAYKDIKNYTEQIFEGSGLDTQELLEDPKVVKAMHYAMINTPTMVDTQSASGADLSSLKSQYSDFINNESFDRKKRENFIKELISKASNKQEAEDYFASKL